MKSFFSQTLTVLNLSYCENVPLTLFLVCPNLREVYLDLVFDSRDDGYPDTQCSGRELPALECLNYRHSASLVKQMITPSPKFSMAVVDWSKLRVLKLCPEEFIGMGCLQPILDAACNTLEELHLTNPHATCCPGGMFSLFISTLISKELQIGGQLYLPGLVNLRHLPNLHVFAVYSVIRSDTPEPVVLRDIKLVLRTIPKANQVTKLSLDLIIYCGQFFSECLEDDWNGMCDEFVRISAGKPLELNLEILITPRPMFPLAPLTRDQLYERIKEKIAPLSDYPNICTNFGVLVQSRDLRV